MAWVRLCMPHSPVVQAALHMDETRWHCHVLLMPRAARDGRPRWGMTAVRHDVDGRITGEFRTRMSKSAVRSAASRLQDDVWEHAGKPYGMARGERGSRLQHKQRLEGHIRTLAKLGELVDGGDVFRRRVNARELIYMGTPESPLNSNGLPLQSAHEHLNPWCVFVPRGGSF